MRFRKILVYVAVFTICILTSITIGQDWLEGGSVGSYRGDIAQYFTDPIFFPSPMGANRQSWELMYYPYFGSEFFRDYAQPYQYTPGIYPGPYGVYPFNPLPYYSDFRMNSLAGMNWEPFQKNWSETMDYARTKSSFRVYPRQIFTIPSTQFPPSIAADTPVTIISQGMRGYQVFSDGNYIGTEGTGGDSLDGRFSFSVVGGQNHEVRVYDGQFNYPKDIYFQRGVQKIIYVEPGTGTYV